MTETIRQSLSIGTVAARVATACRLDQPVLLIGPPGIGKTVAALAGIREYLDALGGGDVETITLAAFAESDFAMPVPDHARAVIRFLPLDLLARARDADRPLVLFLDDLGDAQPEVLKCLMQLLHARKLNDVLLSAHVRFVCASNAPEHSRSVTPVAHPIINRMAVFEVLTSVADLAVHYARIGVADEITAIVQAYPDLIEWREPGEFEQACTPRAMHRFSDLIVTSPDRPDDAEVEEWAGALCGKEFRDRWVALQDMIAYCPTRAQILASPDTAPVPNVGTQEDAKRSGIVASLAAQIALSILHDDPTQIAIVDRYLMRFPRSAGAQTTEYRDRVYRDLIRIQPQIAAEPIHQEWLRLFGLDLFGLDL